MRQLDYLKQHRKATYNRPQTECKPNSYLYEINAHAEEMFDILVNNFKQAEGVTEQFKADNEMDCLTSLVRQSVLLLGYGKILMPFLVLHFLRSFS